MTTRPTRFESRKKETVCKWAWLRFSRYYGWVSSLGGDLRWLKDVLDNHSLIEPWPQRWPWPILCNAFTTSLWLAVIALCRALRCSRSSLVRDLASTGSTGLAFANSFFTCFLIKTLWARVRPAAICWAELSCLFTALSTVVVSVQIQASCFKKLVQDILYTIADIFCWTNSTLCHRHGPPMTALSTQGHTQFCRSGLDRPFKWK